MSLDSVASLVDTLVKLLPQNSPQWLFAGAVLSAFAAIAHAWGVYRGATAAAPAAKPDDVSVRLPPPSLPPEPPKAA